VVGGFVGHEAVDECVGCWLDGEAREWGAEEGGVRGFGLGEAFSAEIVEDVEIVVCGVVGDTGLLVV